MTGAVTAFVLLLALSFFPLPGAAVKVFSVRSGSMEPTIGTGSLIIVWQRPRYGVGDVITLRTRDKSVPSVTHRIVSVRESEAGPVFTTKGDNNEEADIEPVPAGDVVGKLLFSIPLLGYAVTFAQTKTGFLSLIVVPALLIIAGEVMTIVREVRRLAAAHRSAPSNVALPQRLRFSTPSGSPPSAALMRPVAPPARGAPFPAPPALRKRKIV